MTRAAHRDLDAAVRERYSRGARERQPDLCCPVDYDPSTLEAIPAEVLERDYSCGDPSRHIRPGETVLDLGSGSGKICFIASQVVGPNGRVIGIDLNDDMLALARRSQPEVARCIGFDNVTFHKARIQDLALDREAVDDFLRRHPVRDGAGYAELEAMIARLRRDEPLIPDQSIDVVISSCVLNLVVPEDRRSLLSEIHRVLKRGGRAVISDIVSDEEVPERLRSDPELWSGCIAGAWLEEAFPRAFEEAGFYGISVDARSSEPWRTIEGIEFRSATVIAYAGKEGPCWDHRQAVIYRGPFKRVVDDDGHILDRGVRTAVCEKTFQIYSRSPYRSHVEPVEPLEPVAPARARPFPCTGEPLVRHPRETKGEGYAATRPAAKACDPEAEGGCC